MSEQRSRRAFLRGVAAAGIGAVGGCTTLSTASKRPVSLLVAGSLADAVENGLRAAVDRPLRVAAHGSARVARMVAAGQRDPDVVSLADVSLFGRLIEAPWFARFATTSLVVAYTESTPGGRRVGRAGREGWYRALRSPEVRLGRTDPDLDPLGYRTLFALELAGDYYDDAGPLRERLPARDQIYPETQLLSQFETGGIDAAITYRSVAAARGFDYVDLPAAVDLSDPSLVDRYRRVSYTLPDGTTVRGGPIVYGSTARRDAPAVRSVLAEHLSGEYLDAYGFGTPEPFPAYAGDPPAWRP